MIKQYEQWECPVFGCGEVIELYGKERSDPSLAFCPHCLTPLWPIELGFTGNSRETILEFERTHNQDGTSKS
jgi:hypothetical protein